MKRTIIFFTIIILALFSLTYASAADDDQITQDETTQPNLDDQNLDDQNLEIENPETHKNKTVTNHTISAINQAIESDCTIYLEPGEYTKGTVSINSQNNIRIVGNSAILDAQGSENMFDIRYSSNITIENVTIKNCKDNSYSAIHCYQSSTVNIDGCTFINNTRDMDGGAIWMHYNAQDCTVSNCVFIGNNATYNGGAIYWTDGSDNGRILNCIFINNTADTGVIFWYNNNNCSISNCIFLNNNLTDDSVTDDLVCTASPIDADSIWFGKTADNYKDPLPRRFKINFKSILFLDATASKKSVNVLDTADITFKLRIYDLDSGNVSECDNTPFKKLNLTVTSTNGNVNKNIVKLNEKLTFTAKSINTATITATAENCSYAVKLNVTQSSTKVVASKMKTAYHSGKYLTATLKTASGKPISNAKVSVKTKKTKTYTTDKNGKIKVPTSALGPKTYTAKITYKGDKNYKKSSKSVKLTIKKATPKVTGKSQAARKYVVTLKDGKGAIKKAKLTLNVKGKKYTVTTNSKGKATFKLSKGKYTATLKYGGNKYYNAVTKKLKISMK